MKILRSKSKVSTVALVLILTITATLMTSSSFMVFSNSTVTTGNASAASAVVQAAIPSDLLQYEWPMGSADSACSRSSAGPGPDTPNIKWKISLPDVSSSPVAFNGMVFVSAYPYGLYGPAVTYALDGGTGDIVWTALGGGLFMGAIKIDDTYMMLGNTCVKTADGTTVWTAPPEFEMGVALSGASYIPEEKMLLGGGSTLVGVPLALQGWSLPDPSKPPTKVWDREGEPENYGAETPCAYGDGILVVGTGDNFLRGIDVKTGNTVWTTAGTTSFLYGMSYYDGKVIHGGLDNNMRAWNISTGELLWTYNPGTWYGQWASATSAAYGMVYEHNQDTYVYAINATTGELVWRAKGPGIGYSNTLTIAGGKVYVQMGENQYRDFETGEWGYSEFDCFDAYTGEKIWSLPIENGAPFNLQCNAYGNLYLVPTLSTGVPGVWTYSGLYGYGMPPLGEVWCISNEVQDWPMFLCDPEHTADGSGPTNLTVKWKFQADSGIVSSPTLVDGVCYFGTLNHSIYAIDANSGTKLWAFKTNHAVKSTVAVVNGKVYTGADDGNIYCLDAATGNKLWETYAGGIKINPIGSALLGSDWPRSSPMVVGGRVYVGSLDGNLYCLDANSGTVLWKFQTGGFIYATPTIVDNEIYIPSSTPTLNGAMYKLDLNGNVVWNVTIPYELYKTIGSGMWLLASATVAPDLGMVFVRNGLRLNYALNATTGETIWTYDGRYNPGTPLQSGGVSQVMGMLYKHGMVYMNDYYGLVCLDALNGSEIWFTWLTRENIAQGLSYSCGRIYTVNEAGLLYVLDAMTGKKLSYYYFGNLQMHSMPIPYNGSLYVGTNDWNLYCFEECIECTAMSLSATLSTNQVNMSLSESVVVSGSLSPIDTPVQVIVTFDKADGTYKDVPVKTDVNGIFEVSYTPDVAGNWTAVAVYEGDKYHTTAYSENLPLTVVEAEEQPTTPPPEEGIPIEYIYAVVAIIAIVIIAVAAYAYMKRGKK